MPGAALTAAGAAPGDVVMSLDTGGVKYWTGHPGVVAPADPIATIERVARAYDARWLLVERKDTVAALAPLLADRASPQLDRPERLAQPVGSRLPAGGRPLGRLGRGALPDLPRPRPTRGAAHDRPRGLAERRARLRGGARRAVDLRRDRSASRPPRTPRTTSGVARNVVEGRGLVSDAIWSFQTPPLQFPRPAFEVWLPLPTPARRPGDGDPRADASTPPRSRPSWSGRSSRCSPGGSPPTSPRSAGWRRAGPARWRSGPG